MRITPSAFGSFMAQNRSFAVVGSGVAGLVTAHGLLRRGFDVTLYSDRTAEQWLNESRPTGSAARFEPALAVERALGLDHWEADAPKVQGAHLTYCPMPGNRLATMTGWQSKPGVAIDVRLQSHRWTRELVERGGRVEVEHVTVERLDQLAAEHDLVIVASGKADLCQLFPRDPVRSVFDSPRRAVAMVIVHGPSLMREGIPFCGVKNNILEGVGEAVWIPYFHRDVGPCWNLIFEAKIGGPMDIFQGAKTGEEAFDCARRVIETLVPWDADWAREMRLADPLGWQVGRITPTVRSPVGRLPSGRVVTGVGDAIVLFDPLAAQGANNGARMSRHLVEAIVAQGDRPFDAAWMSATFDRFWAAEGEPAFALTNLMLQAMSPAGQILLIAQYGSDGARKDGKQAIADAFAEGFANPASLVPLLTDVEAAKRLVTEKTGRWWGWSVASGIAGIARAQLRQRLGLSPGHPAAQPALIA